MVVFGDGVVLGVGISQCFTPTELRSLTGTFIQWC